MSDEALDIPVEAEPKPKRMSWMAWVIVVMCLVGYWICFEGVWYVSKAGTLYEAALAGNYNPVTKFVSYLVMGGCVPMVLVALVLAPSMHRWVTALLLGIGVGLFGATCLLGSHTGTNHSEGFLRGVGDRMIRSGDIAALKVVAAEKSGKPWLRLSAERRESLARVLSFVPEYMLVPAEERLDAVVLTYGRVVEVMVGPDDMESPVGWDASRAVKVAPGVFLIGGENEW